METCSIACNDHTQCVWMQFTTSSNKCELFENGCVGVTDPIAGEVSSYRPYDFVQPSVTKNACTHRGAFARVSSTVTKCSDFGTDFSSCLGDSECIFVPPTQVSVPSSDTT
jgi:hypothetical protein